MADDVFTEVSSQSWFGRIGESIKGILVGCLLFALSFPLLFWNEGRAVKRYRTLKEGAATVQSVAAETVAPNNEGQLVHLSGTATTDETLEDASFGVSAKGLKLLRKVEMYQWEETSRKETKKKLGGGTTTVTTYEYSKEWKDGVIDSSSFRKREGHENPTQMPFETREVVAREAAIGAFGMSPGLLAQMNDYTPVTPNSVPATLTGKASLAGSGFYIGQEPAVPQIGDCRIRFSKVDPATVSVVAKQIGSVLSPYQTKAGGSIELLQMGTVAADAMFAEAQRQNRILTWILRLVGFLVMGIGLSLVVRPLSVVADVIPFLGSLVGAATGIMAFFVAAALSLVTIAIAWITFRPLLGVCILAGAVALMVPVGRRIKRKK